LTYLSPVIAGPPRSGETRQSIISKEMDARVKPAHDGGEAIRQIEFALIL
jgi:hypothetical protein